MGVHYDNYNLHCVVALRKESVDRNDDTSGATGRILRSLSARRAWIEIQPQTDFSYLPIVALRKESVDRNPGQNLINGIRLIVALRKESVDRNFCVKLQLPLMMVALRKESVDRNGPAISVAEL